MLLAMKNNLYIFFYHLVKEIFRHYLFAELLEDPYLMDEEDPAECRALESSLWEIKVCVCVVLLVHTSIIQATGYI